MRLAIGFGFGSSGNSGGAAPPPPLNTAPVITGGPTTATFAENQTVGTTIGTYTATDAEGNTLTWSVSTLTGTSGLVEMVGNVLKFAVIPDFEVHGASHSYRVQVTDGSSIATRDIALTITDVAEGGGGTPAVKTIQVDFGSSGFAAGGTWRGMTSASGTTNITGTLADVLDILDVASGWTVTITNAFQGTGSLGVNTGANSGAYPDNAIRTYYYVDKALDALATLELSGLNPAKVYTIDVMPSRSGTGTRNTVYTIGASSQTVNALGNSATVASFTGISPNGSGIITLTVAPGPDAGDTFGYLCTLVLKETGDGTPTNAAPTLTGPSTAGLTDGDAPGTVAATYTGNDTDGDPLTYSIVSGNGSGAFAMSTNQLQVASSGPITTGATFTIGVKCNDGTADSNTVSTTITVAASGGGAFTLASLFASSEIGEVWDLKDLDTLATVAPALSTSAAPVRGSTTVAQVIGKAHWSDATLAATLAAASELLTNNDFSGGTTGWTLTTNGGGSPVAGLSEIVVTAGVCSIQRSGSGTSTGILRRSQSITPAIGKALFVGGTTTATGTTPMRFRASSGSGGTGDGQPTDLTGAGYIGIVHRHTAAQPTVWIDFYPQGNGHADLDSVSLKTIPAFVARTTGTTTGERPALQADGSLAMDAVGVGLNAIFSAAITATVVHCDSAGTVTILESQAVGTTWAWPAVANLTGLLVINRGLTLTEKSDITTWFQARAAA